MKQPVKSVKTVKASKNGKASKPAAVIRKRDSKKSESKAETKKQRKDRLLAEREVAELELARLREQMQTEIEHDADEGDPDVYEREKLLAVIRALEDKMESLEHALKALDQGQYGICERCGGEIGGERLKAVPGTTLCVKCKAETEKILKRGFSTT